LVHYGGVIDEKKWSGIGFDASAGIEAVIERTFSTRHPRDDVSHPRAKAGAKARAALRALEKEARRLEEAEEEERKAVLERLWKRWS
jgi:hypothetical protein